MRTGSPPTSSVHAPGACGFSRGRFARRRRDPAVANPSLTEIAGVAVLSMGFQVADQRHTLACRPRAISILRHEAQGSATNHTCDGTHATAPGHRGSRDNTALYGSAPIRLKSSMTYQGAILEIKPHAHGMYGPCKLSTWCLALPGARPPHLLGQAGGAPHWWSHLRRIHLAMVPHRAELIAAWSRILPRA